MESKWKTLCAAAMALACLAASAWGADNGRAEPTAEQEGRLVVHEWGTFTNFSGSSGLQLEFRPLLDSDLPSFVYDRAMQSAGPWALLTKSGYRARQRMETPVTYFYTDRPREVEVRVDFPQGLLTEFYPPVRQMGPKYLKEPAKLEQSFLDWGPVLLHPPAEFAALRYPASKGKTWQPELPKVEGDNHYAFARETDSAVIEFTSSGLLGKHFEKFLFYRGLGSFSLPLTLRALGEGRFEVVNSGPDAIRSLFLVHVEGDGLSFTYSPLVEAHSTLKLEQSASESSVPQLGEAVVASLLQTGLYEKEARAMVKTWQSSWFGEQGTRLFYLLPPRLTDELLPLTVSPAPDEVVRVLVGRMEVLTPEQSERINVALADLGTCASLHAAPLQGELMRLGRFAEPALGFLRSTSTNSDQRSRLNTVLEELEQQRRLRALK